MKESTSSSEGHNSISSFSSEDISFKEKFEKEQQKNTRLQEKLQGYQSVASQFGSFVQENKQLKEELQKLKSQEILCPGSKEKETEGWTELIESPPHIKSKSSSVGSSSFEVISHHQAHNYSGFNLNGSCNGRLNGVPVNKEGYSLVGSNQQISYTSTINPSHSSRSSQESKQGQQQHLQKYLEQQQQRQQQHLQSQQHQDQLGQTHQQACLDNSTIPSSTIQMNQKSTGIAPPQFRSCIPTQNNSSSSCDLTLHSSVKDAMYKAVAATQKNEQPAHQDRINSTTELVCETPSSFIDPSLSEKEPSETPKVASSVCQPNEVVNKDDREIKLVPLQLAPILAPLEISSWGVGARPKDTNYLERSHSNITPPPQAPKESGTKGNNLSRVQENIANGNIVLQQTETMNNISVQTNDMFGSQPSNKHGFHLNIPSISSSSSSQATTLAENDLMTFPSVKTQQNTHSEGTQPSSHSFQVLDFPSDQKEPPLASQAQSMVERLQSGGAPEGMSQMLFKFAQNAADMERKITEYEVLIQRQQVQIQNDHKTNNDIELQRLREENTNLKDFLKTQLENSKTFSSKKIAQEKLQKSEEQIDSSQLKQKVEELTHINEQLYKANKEWHSKWQRLQQNTVSQKQRLEDKITSLDALTTTLTNQNTELTNQNAAMMDQMTKLKTEITALDNHVQEANAAKMKSIQANFDLNQEKLNLSRELELMKAQCDDLMRLRRRQEQGVGADKKPIPKPEACGEVELLKQQLALFHDDFQREREDRSKAVGKADKLRKERDSARMEQANKMKKMQALLSAREHELTKQGRQMVELQHQVISLKKEREQRRTAEAPQRIAQVSSPGQHVLCPSGGPRSLTSTSSPGPGEATQNYTYPLATRPSHLTPRPLTSPSDLSNAWQCLACTFINFPERTVCDICGYRNQKHGEQAEFQTNDLMTGLPELKSRGEYNIEPRTDEPDLVTEREQ